MGTLTSAIADQRHITTWTATTSRLGPSFCAFLFFNARAILEDIFFPFHCPTFLVGCFWAGGACTPMISISPPSSSYIFLHSFIAYHRPTYARRNHTHASIHALALVPFIPPSPTRTHFLEVYILGRSFGSFPVFSSNSFFGFL